MNPISEHTVRRIVEFSETDMAGIVHFSQFFRYIESAEHALWRATGLSVASRQGELAVYGWPRVSVHFDFKAPLRFEEEFDTRAVILELRTRAIRFGFVVSKLDGTLVGRGGVTAVCVTKNDEGTMSASPIPGLVTDAFQPITLERAKELGFSE